MKNKLFAKQVVDENGNQIPVGVTSYGGEYAGLGVVLSATAAIIPGVTFVPGILLAFLAAVLLVGLFCIYRFAASRTYVVLGIAVLIFGGAFIGDVVKHNREVKAKEKLEIVK